MHGLIFETSICYWQDQPGHLFIIYSDGASSATGQRSTFTVSNCKFFSPPEIEISREPKVIRIHRPVYFFHSSQSCTTITLSLSALRLHSQTFHNPARFASPHVLQNESGNVQKWPTETTKPTPVSRSLIGSQLKGDTPSVNTVNQREFVV
ncbi:hypothetical protein OUZ56_033918 [Daphnia magna]|uniref:Uncharacterized protein n=1 Tax=Daphnia magna TaxID=35525 RepID=A0ABR0BB91_9CRUS|nr:hypothetical protein OUZ56_033918 [Daphnia magna]